MNPQKHSASVAEEQMLAHFRAHAPQQPAPALDQAILAAARRQAGTVSRHLSQVLGVNLLVTNP